MSTHVLYLPTHAAAALNDELPDEQRMERLKRIDRLSRDLDQRRYAEFTRARQVSFLGHNMKFASKFQEWILTGISNNFSEVTMGGGTAQTLAGATTDQKVKMDRSGLEALAYLAYEVLQAVVISW